MLSARLATHRESDPAARIAALSRELDHVARELEAKRPATAATPGSAFTCLLSGRGGPENLTRLGIPRAGARIAIVELPNEEQTHPVHRWLARDPDVVATEFGGRLVLLLRGTPRRSDEDRSRRVAARLAREVLREFPAALIGVSAPMDEDSAVGSVHAEAAQALHLAATASTGLAFADEHWASLAVHRLADGLHDALTTRNPLRRLSEYDEKHGCDLTGTVGSWLQANCDVAKTAVTLSIHPNTMRYRLRRAGEVSGLDLSDPDVRLVALLAFRSRAVMS